MAEDRVWQVSRLATAAAASSRGRRGVGIGVGHIGRQRDRRRARRGCRDDIRGGDRRARSCGATATLCGDVRQQRFEASRTLARAREGEISELGEARAKECRPRERWSNCCAVMR